MSREKVGYELGQKLALKLEGIPDKGSIKNASIEAFKELKTLVSEGNFSGAFNYARKAIRESFPDKELDAPGYYWTNSGKGQTERYEHLALYYFSTKQERWEEVEQTTEQLIETFRPVQTTLDDMNISQLQLDADTQQMVESAIAHSNITLADFVRRACQVYAKTITGKVKQLSEDLTAVSTEELKSDSYKTHPGRADELARRAIYALEMHNNTCTEKSQKWMITQTAIQSLTGSKPATIKAILENYQTRLDDHNTKHELNPYDNRKSGVKIDEVINLVELVPDGMNIL
jgi:ribonuclease HI